MISIIIASVNDRLLFDVKKNIQQTIGVEYEIIAFDNSRGERGLCEIYNLGIKKSKYDLLCFMHEDVCIKTENWGMVVEQLFISDSKLGLIGLAGSSYKSIAPSGWFCNGGPQRINYINLLQRYKFNDLGVFHNCQNPKNEKLSQVVAIDGVWFCTQKLVASKYKFDEDTFKKFHCYDIDFSLSIRPEFKTAVTFDVLLEHFSEGSYDRSWVEETLKLYNKWQNKLPINLDDLSIREMAISEKSAFRFFLKQMRLAGFSRIERLNVILKSKIHTKVSIGLFLKLCLEA